MPSILIAGVGGQGTLLASRIIGNVAISKGYDVKVSEVHGMSQRGGSVVTYVKYSKTKVHSPIIDDGEADFCLAFEELEAYRNVKTLKKDGTLIVNTQQIKPMPVILGNAIYPENITTKITDLNIKTIAIDALKIAAEAGNEKAVNLTLIGVFASCTDIPKQDWLDTIKSTTPERFLQTNLKAFSAGYDHR